MKFPELPVSPEFKAQSEGVAIGVVLGWIICQLTGLPTAPFFILTIISMGLLGIAFTAYDATRANSNRPVVSKRTFFWRGVVEAALGFFPGLGLVAIRSAT